MFKVPDMTCGHCAQTIEKAVKSVDPAAQVKVDLAEKVVTVESSAQEKMIADVVRCAGYVNERLAA